MKRLIPAAKMIAGLGLGYVVCVYFARNFGITDPYIPLYFLLYMIVSGYLVLKLVTWIFKRLHSGTAHTYGVMRYDATRAARVAMGIWGLLTVILSIVWMFHIRPWWQERSRHSAAEPVSGQMAPPSEEAVPE